MVNNPNACAEVRKQSDVTYNVVQLAGDLATVHSGVHLEGIASSPNLIINNNFSLKYVFICLAVVANKYLSRQLMFVPYLKHH